MKQLILIQFLFTFLFSNAYCQENKKHFFGFGVFIGEGTGVSTIFNISENSNIEWNLAINEMFFNYNFTNKYSNRINQDYRNIYSSSILFNFNNKFTNRSKLNYHFAVGSQLRLVTDYFKGRASSLPPNVLVFDDPTTFHKFYIGINPLLGLNYRFGKNISAFCDFGAYIEIFNTFLWSNPQFRIGIMYHFIKEKKE